MYRAKEKFINYFKGDLIPDEVIERHPNWINAGHVEPLEVVQKEPKLSEDEKPKKSAKKKSTKKKVEE